METVVRGMPLEYPPKPERLNAYGKRGGAVRLLSAREEGRGQDGELEEHRV